MIKLFSDSSLSVRRCSIQKLNTHKTDKTDKTEGVFDENLDSRFYEKMQYFRSNENIIVNHNDIKMSVMNPKRVPSEIKTIYPTSPQSSKKFENMKTSNGGNQNFKDGAFKKISKETKNTISKPVKI